MRPTTEQLGRSKLDILKISIKRFSNRQGKARATINIRLIKDRVICSTLGREWVYCRDRKYGSTAAGSMVSWMSLLTISCSAVKVLDLRPIGEECVLVG